MKIFKYTFYLLFVSGYLQGSNGAHTITRYKQNFTNNYEVTDPDEIAPSYAANYETLITSPHEHQLYNDLYHELRIRREQAAKKTEAELDNLYDKALESDNLARLESIACKLEDYKGLCANNAKLTNYITTLIDFIHEKFNDLLEEEEPLTSSDDLEEREEIQRE